MVFPNKFVSILNQRKTKIYMILRYITSGIFLIITFFSFSQKNIQLLGNLQFNQKINDIWGYSNSNGEEYALIGGTTGIFIVDLTNATNPNELFFIEGDTSIWRDVKTYQDFAYVTNENGGGLMIIDLSNLPNTIEYHNWTVDTFNYQKAHNIFIDENGIAFLFGSNIGNQGAFMLDLNYSDRFKPPYVGIYDERYCHDGFVRNNLLYTSEIYEGDFSIIDITNKQNPTVIARHSTSTAFTHQCWLSDDNNYLITTDEKAGAFVDIYDISDINNIERIDKYRSSPDNNVIPHNTFFKDDYIVTSYYRDGITIVDATEKNNLVEVGNYDTSPFPSADGFEGCWGVYPYLPSGNIIASDREEGLFILQATYKRACYLEGTIIDTLNFLPLNDVRVEIIGTKQIKYTTFDGSYTLGVVDPGVYDIRFSLPNCQTIIYSNIELLEGQIKHLDIETNCNFTTGINIFSKNNIEIFPIPFTNKLTFKFDSLELLQEIQFYSPNGKLLKSIKVDAHNGIVYLDCNWEKGIYIAKFIYEFNSISKTIIKQ